MILGMVTLGGVLFKVMLMDWVECRSLEVRKKPRNFRKGNPGMAIGFVLFMGMAVVFGVAMGEQSLLILCIHKY